MVRYKN